MPGSTTAKLYYTYVLQSLKRNYRYVGLTNDLPRRLTEHNQGETFSTKPYRPLKLIYLEGSISYDDAKRREHYLKTTGGRRFLAKRLKYYLSHQ